MSLRPLAAAAAALALGAPLLPAQGSFVNFETPHVHPLDVTPDGQRVLAVNTADGRLEVFAPAGKTLLHLGSVPVGFDPVSVRARGDGEAWVVNQLSDTVSIVDLATLRVTRTLATDDEPADVVFAANRAFVSCSQDDTVLVFELSNLALAPQRVAVDGEEPRALAVSLDGQRVFAAIFESGNGSTILGGGSTMSGGFPPNVVSNPAGPYGGQNPPPNSGTQFSPPIKFGLPAPPKVGLIVKKNAAGQWMDDNAHDWTAFVSGAQAALSGRPVGWDLPDHDVAVIDAATLAVSYANRLMNVNMALAVHPLSGDVTVVGTDCTNEVRFEPNLTGTFVRVKYARVDDVSLNAVANVDLNGHLNYLTGTVPQVERDKSIGDPRGIAWNAAGTKAYVAGMGSNNLVVIDAGGSRVGLAPTIEVGQGPTGVVLGAANLLYVLNKFDGSVSIVDTGLEVEVSCVPFHDPTPAAIRAGRPFLYDTHRTSGLGQVACASCHVDAAMDRMAWDLGDPQGNMKSVIGQNLGANVPGLNTGFAPFHPMKGPMTTQTLKDIIGKEPLHWRGDRNGLEEFNPAFEGLQGDDVQLTAGEMQAYEDFLASLHFPPNPFRNFDNTLPTALDTQQRSPGRFSPKGTPLPLGDAVRGHQIYRPPFLLDAGAIACSSCHTLPTGLGTNSTLSGFTFQPIPPGPNGEKHHMLVSQDGSTNVSIKVPHLRNLHDKVGFDTTLTSNRHGFGYLHDGSVDTIAEFLAEPVFNPTSDQDLADLVAFMLAFAGSDLAYGGSILEPPATASQDAHAAVGASTTLADSGNPAPGQVAQINAMLAQADAGKVGVIVKGVQAALARGYAYQGGGVFQSDRAAELRTTAQMLGAAAPGSELTFTVVPSVAKTRAGIDRDEDGAFDRDELDAGADPLDPTNGPGCGKGTVYAAGCSGSGGPVPRLTLTGCPTAGGTVTLRIERGLGGSFAFLFFGSGQGSVPMGGGCALYTVPLLPLVVGPLPLAPGGPGAGAFTFTTTLAAGLTPGSATLQAFVSDAGTPTGFSNSNGLLLTIQ